MSDSNQPRQADSGTAERHFVEAGSPADVCVVIVTYQSNDDIDAIIDDLRLEARDLRLRIVVADNNSPDGTLERVRTHPDVIAVDTGGNLGYAGGINVATEFAEPCETLLILNPDLRLEPGAVGEMLVTLRADQRIGAVLPKIFRPDHTVYPSIRFEPSVSGLLGDAVFGSAIWLGRPTALSEFDYRAHSYDDAHDVDWATGAAVLIRSSVAREVGPWNESFFLYSEEIDYFRRIRDSGHLIRYQPRSAVVHTLGGSGTSPVLADLLAVNRVRYLELHHGRLYSAAGRASVALSEALRSYDRDHRRRLGIVLRRQRWAQLPTADIPKTAESIAVDRDRGTVIVPAYNESAVIERTLMPLSRAAVDGVIELIVVCNGCTDDTAARARKIPGAQVIELTTGSKTLALNAGDELATSWPRVYLDADIEITQRAVLDILDRLRRGDILAARPEFRYGTDDAGPIVRSYYRARSRMPVHRDALWWAGVYALTEEGHARFGRFPDVTGDDKFVDTQFAPDEKTVVSTDPSIWTTPTNTRGLIKVLGRHQRGNAELAEHNPESARPTGRTTALAVLASVRGPRTAVDALAYLVVATLSRYKAGRGETTWERDDTSRRRR
ncbi:glycosyltransferase [Gordonia sp. DT218]|uniref:glycosyltransferase n=1 Tax=Gordonia sp. DT218 TaxID=3416659 RepID=UPI003CEA79C3